MKFILAGILALFLINLFANSEIGVTDPPEVIHESD